MKSKTLELISYIVWCLLWVTLIAIGISADSIPIVIVGCTCLTIERMNKLANEIKEEIQKANKND